MVGDTEYVSFSINLSTLSLNKFHVQMDNYSHILYHKHAGTCFNGKLVKV